MKRIYFLLLSLFSFFSIEGQNLFFNHLDVKDGLSHSTVQSIYQDEYGQIWFATRNGLNKYDGNTVERINIKVDGLSDFFFNDIMTVTGDGKGKIYIQSMQMLIIFDTQKQTFTTKGARNVRTIYYAGNKVWIGATNKLSYLADGSTEVKEYLALEDKTNLIRSRQSLGTLPKAENTQAQGVNNKDKEFISELESIIKQNIDSSALNVDMLASKMNIARTALFTRLREIAATTPNKLILDIRMATALDIIKSDKDIMINEVAYQIGFHTPSYFINVFKTHYGVTPNEFRKSYFKLD